MNINHKIYINIKLIWKSPVLYANKVQKPRLHRWNSAITPTLYSEQVFSLPLITVMLDVSFQQGSLLFAHIRIIGFYSNQSGATPEST